MWWMMLCCLLGLAVSHVRADVDLDGDDDYLNTNQLMSVFLTPPAGTIMGWVRNDGPADSGLCYSEGTLMMDVGGHVALSRNLGNACAYVFDTDVRELKAVLATGWRHVAMTKAGGVLRLYIDGFEAGNLATTDITGITETAWLGYTAGARIAEIATFSVALSAQEIETIARSRLRYRMTSLPTGYWPLTNCGDGVNGDGVSFLDRSHFNRHATGTDDATANTIVCRASERLQRAWGAQ